MTTLAAITVPTEKTHCRRGHQLTPDNIRLTKQGIRICITCARTATREYMQRWRAEHSQENRQRKRRDYERHAETVKAKAREYFDSHRDEQNARRRRYYAANRARAKEYGRARHLVRGPTQNARVRERRRADPEFFRSRERRYRAAHPDAVKASLRLYFESHRDIRKASALRHHARKKGAAVSDFTCAQWEALKITYGHRCAYCGEQPERLTQDHVIPLTRGGNHTLSNIVPACWVCNRRKGTRAGWRPLLPEELAPL